MDMVTELVVKEVKIKGGARIAVAAYATPNKVLFDSMFWLGKLLRWLMECKSNNMTRAIQPRDIRQLWQLWEAHKVDLDMSQKFSDSPGPVHEFNFQVLLPHPDEMRRYKNLKIQRAANEIHAYIHTAMTRDSASGHAIYEMIDYEEIKELQTNVEEILKVFVGTGKPTGKPGEWDTGVPIPALVELGQEIPKGDLSMMSFAEPSSEAPSHHLPDAPDTDRVGPLVGGNK